MSNLAALLGIFTATFAVPFSNAAEPISIALPQDIDYSQYLIKNVGGNDFSTDPREPRVAQAIVAAESLQIFLVNTNPCVENGAVAAYRLIVRNAGEAIARDVSVTVDIPLELTYITSSENPPTSEFIQGEKILTWRLEQLQAGHNARHEFNLSFTINRPADSIKLDARVQNRAGRALTSQLISGRCDDPPNFVGRKIPPKQPAIICDPSEAGCTQILPNLGVNFSRSQDPVRQPVICSPNDPDACTPNRPNLGLRFAEAIADIVPGECRVLEDDVIATPEFHDALNRLGRPAAPFILPLYNSGQDFIRLVHENQLLGLTNVIAVRKKLSTIHRLNWQEQVQFVQSVVKGGNKAEAYEEQATRWKSRLTQAQADLRRQYQAMQDKRREKFDPIANQAVANAREAITNACGEATDAGLRGLIPPVKLAYDTNLSRRENDFTSTQVGAVGAYAAEIDRLGRALKAAGSNQKLLEDHLRAVQRLEEATFEKLMLPYRQHKDVDERTDDEVRLNQWEIALDTPKQKAADCQKEIDFGPRVETTWCESSDHPEFILQSALDAPTRTDVSPPELIGVNPRDLFSSAAYNASIDEQRVVGNACTGAPGDPTWAFNCSCGCGQLIPDVVDGRIRFCQNAAGIQLRIVRHDTFQDIAQCVRETDRHTLPGPNDSKEIRF